MKIVYYGHACFSITSKEGTTIITDPYTRVGYELPCGLSADAVTVSHGHFDHNYTQAIATKQVIDKAGSYQVNEITVFADSCYHDPMQGKLRGTNLFFKYEIDGIIVCHLGDIGEPLSNELLNRIGKVDVLLIPVGGTYTIDGVQAQAYAQNIGARAVIPMHYKPQDGALDITTAQPFLQEFKGEIINALNGVVEIDENTLYTRQIVIYMERAK